MSGSKVWNTGSGYPTFLDRKTTAETAVTSDFVQENVINPLNVILPKIENMNRINSTSVLEQALRIIRIAVDTSQEQASAVPESENKLVIKAN